MNATPAPSSARSDDEELVRRARYRERAAAQRESNATARENEANREAEADLDEKVIKFPAVADRWRSMDH